MAHDVVFKQLIYQILGLDWPSNRPQSYENPEIAIVGVERDRAEGDLGCGPFRDGLH
jgi:hypothetical protein